MLFGPDQDPRNWFLRLSDIAWGGFYRRFTWHPIAEYDGTSVVLLRSETEHFIGKHSDGQWCVDSAGNFSPLDDFEPTQFAILTDEQMAQLLMD